MKKLNDLIKTKYYAVYENDNCIGAYIDNDDYDNSNSNSNSNYKYIEKECYGFYDDGNFDTAESTEMVVLNISINEELQEICDFVNNNILKIDRVIDNYYGGSIDVKRFGSLAGLIQQYLFYYIKFNEQEM